MQNKFVKNAQEVSESFEMKLDAEEKNKEWKLSLFKMTKN